MSSFDDLACTTCGRRPAVICSECQRAHALLDSPSGFAAIARHVGDPPYCRWCEIGTAALCVECECARTVASREPDILPGPNLAQFAAEIERVDAHRSAVAGLVEQGLQAEFPGPSAPYTNVGPSWYRMLEDLRAQRD